MLNQSTNSHFLFQAGWLEERMMMQLQEPIDEALAESRFNRWAHIYGNSSCLLRHIQNVGWSVSQARKVLGGASLNRQAIEAVPRLRKFFKEANSILQGVDSELIPVAEFVDKASTQALYTVQVSTSQLASLNIKGSVWESLLSGLKLKIASLSRSTKIEIVSCGDSKYLESSDQNLILSRYMVNNFPVLIRLIHETIDNWITATNELLLRLSDDAEEIGLGKPLGDSVASIQRYLSDPHNRGRTVDVVIYTSGRRIIYKPVDLGIHQAFSSFLHQISNLGFQSGLFVPKVLIRDGYGWMNWVEHRSCDSLDEVKTYYYRLGVLLCILYVLDGTDMHSENVIACGSYPTLIDLECLFSNFSKEIASTDFQELKETAKYPITSVIKTGILPISEECNLSVLGSYRHLNNSNSNKKHECLLNDISLNPLLFLEDLICGFEDMYDFFCLHKISVSNVINRLFRNIFTRFSARQSQLYSLVQRRALQPKFLFDGVDFSIEIDVLKTSYHSWTDTQKLFLPDKLLNEEYESIRNLDIPIFFGNTSDTNLYDSNGKIILQNYFDSTAISLVLMRLSSLNTNDRIIQSKIISDSLLERYKKHDINV
jgi:lantibiotic modifying enzyme